MDQPHDTDYGQFTSRLQTFIRRPASVSQVSSIQLAIRGFIFCEDGVDNLIWCPFCFQSYNDDMEQLSYTHREDCPFVHQSENQSQHNYSSIFYSRVNVDNPENLTFYPNNSQRLETDIAIQSLRSQRLLHLQGQGSSRQSSEMRNLVLTAPTISSTLATVPPTLATVPSSLATVPSSLATVPSSLATGPSTLATVPSSLATVPSSLATVLSTLATVPPTLATVPSTLTTVPSSLSTVPSSLATVPSSLATVPSSLSTVPSSLATVPSSLATVPSSLATVPSSLATVPSTLTTVPSSLSTVPSSLATVPSSLATVPSTLTTVPSSLSTVPSSLATVPSSLATVPSTLATVPSTLTTVPSSLSTVPSSLSTVPSSLSTVPSSLSTVPSSLSTVPSSLSTVPSSLSTVPSSLSTVPSSLSTVPSSLSTVPSSLSTVPSTTTTATSTVATVTLTVATVTSTVATVTSTVATVTSTVATVTLTVATVTLTVATVTSTVATVTSTVATVTSSITTVTSALSTATSAVTNVTSAASIFHKVNPNTTERDTAVPTCAELGIITERPKRFDYALFDTRLRSFLFWPKDHHLKPKELAEAGFYYAGYGDCARCFYCGGGLRNCGDEDDVWVEHARWFPKCAYIRQKMGQDFVDKVQELNKTKENISFKDVEESMEQPFLHSHEDSEDFWKRQSSVKAVVEMGYPMKTVIAAAKEIRKKGDIVSADVIVERLSKLEKKSDDPAYDLKQLRTLKEQNNQLRQQTVCKICMDKEVAVVFLPCDHFVSCVDCASALKDCPVCRKQILGIMRAFIS